MIHTGISFTINRFLKKVIGVSAVGIVPALFVCLQAQSITTLQKELTTTKSDTHRVRVLYELSHAYWLSGQDSIAILYSRQSLELARKLNFLKGEGNARLRLVRIEADRQADLEGAYAQLDTILQIATRLNDRHMEAESYVRKSQLLGDNLTRQKEIIPLLDKANAIFVELGDKSWQGLIYNEKAQLVSRSGRYSQSVEFYLKARQLQEEANDLAGLRSTLPNLGVAYSALGLYKEALKIFDEASIVAQKRDDTILKGFVLNQQADIYEKQGQFAKALKILTEAAAIHKKTQTTYWLPKTYSRMGKVYLQLKDYDNALKYTSLGDKLYREVVDSEDFLDHLVQINYSKIYLARKEYAQAIRYATEGLKWANDSDPPLQAERSEYHLILANAYEASGNVAKALAHFKKYKTDSDSLLNKESLQKATVSAMNYEFDKQRQQTQLSLQTLRNEKLTQSRNFLIALSVLALSIAGLIFWSNRKLTHKNEQLTRKNQEIEEALYKGQHLERKRVASELHDNLNTKLAALRWRMEAWDVSDYSAADQTMYAGLIQMLEDIYSDVRLISHNLLPTELQTHGLASALQKLTDKLNYNPDIQFKLHVGNDYQRPSSTVEFELYNVALELINNSIKHSRASQVVLNLAHNTQRTRLSVSDNGVGFTPDPKTSGIGLHNIMTRVDTLAGYINIHSAPGNGTRVDIDVPA
jgi:signal transduction histidine kinase